MHWRHEQLTLQMALAAALHHSRDVGPVSYPARRSQRTARAGGVEREVNFEPRLQNPPLPQAASTVFFTFGDDEEVLAAGERPASLAEPPGPVGKPACGYGSWCFRVPDVTVPLVMEEEKVAAPFLVSQEPVIVQELPEVLVASSLARAVQPADVEQVLDVPALHMIDIDNHLYEFLDLGSFQEIPEVQDVELHIPPGPVPENFVEQVVGVPVAHDFLPGHAQQLDTCTPASWLGAPQEHFEGGFFALFPSPKKVRRLPGSRVRECTRTRAHPRWLLIMMMRGKVQQRAVELNTALLHHAV